MVREVAGSISSKRGQKSHEKRSQYLVMMVFLWESLVFLVGFLGPRASALASGTPLEMERGAWYLCQYMGPPVHGPVGNGKARWKWKGGAPGRYGMCPSDGSRRSPGPPQ